MTITLNGTTGIVNTGSETITGALTAANFNGASTFGFKNRIINGAMVIDQRNAGAALTVNSGTDFFPVDRFLVVGTAASGVFTVQRSSTAPTGFINSILATVTTTDASLAATDQYYVSQIIEGLNVADLAWGTASAATVTLSFWVYSSLGPGTFGGAVRNSAANRSYPFTYTISSANTWERKSVTIAGDTTGTWLTTNGKGLDITWTLGLGSTFSGTAGVWAGANYKGASGVTNVMATNGATFYITGVQLETGTVATTFEYRPYGTELQLCQRYLPAFSGAGFIPSSGPSTTTTVCPPIVYFPVATRAAPTGLTVSAASDWSINDNNVAVTGSSIVFEQASTTASRINFTTGTASLTAGRSGALLGNSSAKLFFTGAEL